MYLCVLPREKTEETLWRRMVAVTTLILLYCMYTTGGNCESFSKEFLKNAELTIVETQILLFNILSNGYTLMINYWKFHPELNFKF